MIRINRETDYAVLLLSQMATEPERRYSAAWLAEQRGLPAPMVSKILKALVRAGLLVSVRGAKGGYALARPPGRISLADIVAAMEGPISLTHCVDSADSCQYHSGCVASSNWSRINQVIKQALEGISLLEMTQPMNPVPAEVTVPMSVLGR